MTCVRCNQIRFQSLNAFGAMRENFKRFRGCHRSSPTSSSSCGSHSDTGYCPDASRGTNYRQPPLHLARSPINFAGVFTFAALLTNWIYVRNFQTKSGGKVAGEEATHVRDWNQFWQSVSVLPPLFLSSLTKEILKQFARLMRLHVKFFNCLQIGSICEEKPRNKEGMECD